jgi:uncharacterized repeat protein (TIGR03803 family)
MSKQSRDSWSLTKNAPSKLRISRNLFSRPKILLSTLLAGLGLMVASPVEAQTFTTLCDFSEFGVGTFPAGGLILSGNTLYGTTAFGEYWGDGSVFSVNIDGKDFATLYIFTAISYTYPSTNSDGADPFCGLVLSGSTFYGTTQIGGAFGNGTVFALNPGLQGFTTLYSFPTNAGDWALQPGPVAGLVLSGNTLYGTTVGGGDWDSGTVFAIQTDGKCYTNLYSFTGEGDGGEPRAGLILSGNTLYGTSSGDGSTTSGTVFSINTNGSNFTNLYSFTGESDGGEPMAGLILSGNTLYGTTHDGGTSNFGTVFSINTNGSNFTSLHSFAGSDGWGPAAGLILSGNTLFGTTEHNGNGNPGPGTIFAVNINGANFMTLHTFAGFPNDGAFPQAGLILSGNTLYGTTSEGGSLDTGTIFSLSLPASLLPPPQLAITIAGTNVILTWPTNAAGFTLESTTNLLPAAWSTNLPAPVVINGQNTVTNPVSGTHRFYQLIH